MFLVITGINTGTLSKKSYKELGERACQAETLVE